MTDTTATETGATELEPEGHTTPAEHASDLLYVKVAAILAVITGAEIALPYLADVEGPVIAVMLIMMVLKFGLVVAYFMHLKYDSKLFRRVFVFGLLLAVGVYIAALTTFEFWG